MLKWGGALALLPLPRRYCVSATRAYAATNDCRYCRQHHINHNATVSSKKKIKNILKYA